MNKTAIGVIVGVVSGVVIVVGAAVGAGYFLGLFTKQPSSGGEGIKPPISSPSPSLPSLPPSPAPSPSPPSLPPSPAPAPSLPSLPPSPAPAPSLPSLPPSPAPSPSTLPTVKVGVFEFAITDVSGTGLSRTITAQVTNTGTTDAHNAWAKVEVFSQQSRIKLSGQDYLREEIGTIKAKATITRQVTLSLSPLDGLKIVQNGAQVVLTITSDERTETWSYDYRP